MEQNNQITVSQPGPLNLSTPQKAIGIGLTASEADIIRVKYADKRFCDTSAEQLPVVFKTLLFRIHTITGWKIPEDIFFLTILLDEFSKFILENFSNLNAEEITYAFRNYGTDVKDWGKSMNLSLINEPINKYLSHRKCLSEIEERINPKIIGNSEIIIDDQEFLNTVKTVYLKTKLPGLLPVKAYDILASRGEIKLSQDQKAEIRRKVEKNMADEAMQGSDAEQRNLAKLRGNKANYEEKVRNECKRLSVALYFNI